MASPGYTIIDKTGNSIPPHWRGWYYKPHDHERPTGPFTTREMAVQAAKLWQKGLRDK